MYFVSKLEVLRFESLLRLRILEILNFHQSNSDYCTIGLILRKKVSMIRKYHNYINDTYRKVNAIYDCQMQIRTVLYFNPCPAKPKKNV